MPSQIRKKAILKKWPCAVCCLSCDVGSVQCDSCEKWVHVKCEGLNEADLKYLSGLTYMCRICINVEDRDSYSYNNALYRLREAAGISHDHLHVVAKREKTLMPYDFEYHGDFDRSHLRVDFSALGYLESCEDGIQIDHQPILTTGDGNCMFNALSISICGTEHLNEELRVRTCVEMVTNEQYYLTLSYAKEFLLCSPSFEESCRQCATLGGYSSAWTLQAASNALQRDIYSVYPKMNGQSDHTATILTRVHSTRNESKGTLSIMWTKVGPHFGKTWLPNHFVPLLTLSDDANDNDEPESCSSGIKGATSSKSENSSSNISESNISVNEGEFLSSTPRSYQSESNEDIIQVSVGINEQNTKEVNVNNELHALPNGQFLSVEDLLNTLHGDLPTISLIPRGKKDNVFLLLDGEDNIKCTLSGKKACYYDDCGVWNSKKARSCKTTFLLEMLDNGQTNIRFIHLRDGVICIEKKVKGKVIKTPLDPQPCLENVVTLHRYYTVLKADETYKRRVSWFENLPESMSNRKYVTVIEYQGQNHGPERSHGNSKHNEQPYKRTNPITIEMIKEAVKTQKPIDAYNKLTKLDDSALYPKDLRQCQNFKSNTKSRENKSKNAADEMLHILKELEGHPFVNEVVHTNKGDPPIMFCCSDEQLADLKSFIKSNGGVIGIDRTFLLGRCYVTLLVYKSQKVVRKENGEAPIMLGPLMLHWDGTQKTYYRFFTFLRGILDLDLKEIEMLIGTDDEKAMTSAIDDTFPNAKRRLCTKHIKDNLIRNMADKMKTSKTDRNSIIHKLFGANGVASANDSAIFDERNIKFKDSLKDHPEFLNYYVKHVENKIADHCINEEDKLWTNNNTESINNRLKVSIDWKPKKTDELVSKLYDATRVQHIDVRRAIYGTGNYSLSPKFSKFKLTESVWRSKSESEKQNYQFKFLNATSKVEVPTHIVSSCGEYTIGHRPAVAKKPGQKTRPKVTRTFTPRK